MQAQCREKRIWGTHLEILDARNASFAIQKIAALHLGFKQRWTGTNWVNPQMTQSKIDGIWSVNRLKWHNWPQFSIFMKSYIIYIHIDVYFILIIFFIVFCRLFQLLPFISHDHCIPKPWNDCDYLTAKCRGRPRMPQMLAASKGSWDALSAWCRSWRARSWAVVETCLFIGRLLLELYIYIYVYGKYCKVLWSTMKLQSLLCERSESKGLKTTKPPQMCYVVGHLPNKCFAAIEYLPA